MEFTLDHKPLLLHPSRLNPWFITFACVAGVYNWEDEVAVAWWLTQPLGSACRQWGLSVSSFPDSSGCGWNLALGRSDGGRGLGLARGYRKEDRGLACDGGGSQPSRAQSQYSAQTAFESVGSLHESDPSSPSALSQQKGSGFGSTTADDKRRLPAEYLSESAHQGLVFENGSSFICSDQGLEVPSSAPFIAEASLMFPLGEGVHVIPGLVAVRHDGQMTLSLVARTQWYF